MTEEVYKSMAKKSSGQGTDTNKNWTPAWKSPSVKGKGGKPINLIGKDANKTEVNKGKKGK